MGRLQGEFRGKGERISGAESQSEGPSGFPLGDETDPLRLEVPPAHHFKERGGEWVRSLPRRLFTSNF